MSYPKHKITSDLAKLNRGPVIQLRNTIVDIHNTYSTSGLAVDALGMVDNIMAEIMRIGEKAGKDIKQEVTNG